MGCALQPGLGFDVHADKQTSTLNSQPVTNGHASVQS
jgi:hypothetical protein